MRDSNSGAFEREALALPSELPCFGFIILYFNNFFRLVHKNSKADAEMKKIWLSGNGKWKNVTLRVETNEFVDLETKL